jgi:hypothetical protein
VPTQKDIQEQGDNLAQTDVVLLQKIKENTLYIVAQQKQLDEYKREITEQKKQIEALAKKIEEKK